MTKLFSALIFFILAITPAYAGREFNGTSQGAEAASVDLSGVQTVSLSMWFYVDSWGSAGTFPYILHFTDDPDGTPPQTGFRVYANVDGPEFIVDNKGDVGNNTATYSMPSTGGWHHYVFTFDKSLSSNEVNYYLDGSLQTPSSRPSNDNNTNNFSQSTLHLASFNETSDWKAGRFADVAVWNVVLSSGDVTSLNGGTLPTSVQASNLKGYWKFCGAASPEPDSSSGNHSMTLTGSPTQVAHPASPAGVANSCAVGGRRTAQPMFFQ